MKACSRSKPVSRGKLLIAIHSKSCLDGFIGCRRRSRIPLRKLTGFVKCNRLDEPRHVAVLLRQQAPARAALFAAPFPRDGLAGAHRLRGPPAHALIPRGRLQLMLRGDLRQGGGGDNSGIPRWTLENLAGRF